MDYNEQSDFEMESEAPSDQIAEENTNTEDETVVFPDEQEEKVDSSNVEDEQPPKNTRKISYGFFASAICIIVAITVLLTYTLTSAFMRAKYTDALIAQKNEMEELEKFEPLATISTMLDRYSYYSDEMSEEEMVEAALRAYVASTGDRYAAYYTKEEYEAMNAATGDYAGIGAGTIQDKMQYGGFTYYGYTVSYFYKNSPAQNSGLQKGDFIYAVKVDGVFKTVEELGGYDAAMTHIRGAIGTPVELGVLRQVADGIVEAHTFSITRVLIEDPAVFYEKRIGDPTTALVSIRRFDLDTPHLFKNTVNKLLSENVEHFVFDVRDNPGGDLLSIKAVLSYFLKDGDMILSAIDKNGTVAKTYTVEPMNYTDEYKACNVTKEEIGLYADLDMVVLCNENTASAAEVFTATLRDYQMAKVVGVTTFGKGIMQMIFDLSTISNFTGYLKLTTHAYVTKCGETYHEIGIKPDGGLEVALSDVAKEYSMYDLPQILDNQLQTAFSQFTPNLGN